MRQQRDAQQQRLVSRQGRKCAQAEARQPTQPSTEREALEDPDLASKLRSVSEGTAEQNEAPDHGEA